MVITTSSLFMPPASVFTYICACVKVIERAACTCISSPMAHSAKMRVELLVLMLFVCMTVGEFFQLIQMINCVLFLAWQVRMLK